MISIGLDGHSPLDGDRSGDIQDGELDGYLNLENQRKKEKES